MMEVTLRQQYRDRIVDAIEHLINSGRIQIPPYPKLAMRLAQLLEPDDLALSEVVELVKSDQALSAQVLRYYNSAGSGHREETSLERAIAFMGMEQLYTLACTAALRSSETEGPLSEVRRAVWGRTMMRAHTAQQLAKIRGSKPEVAFLCGLLCDFGKVTTISCIERFIAADRRIGAMPLNFWLGIVHIYEGPIGLMIADRWNLPEALKSVMRAIATQQVANNPMAELVVTADQVVGVLRSRPYVTIADLADVRLTNDLERERLLEALPRIAEILAKSASDAPHTKRAVSTQVVLESSLREPRKARIPVFIQRSRTTIRLDAIAVAYDGIVLLGSIALPLQELFRMSIQAGGGELNVFGNAVSTSRTPAGHQHIVHFFAMTREQRHQWERIVQSVPSGSPINPTVP